MCLAVKHHYFVICTLGVGVYFKGISEIRKNFTGQILESGGRILKNADTLNHCRPV